MVNFNIIRFKKDLNISNDLKKIVWKCSVLKLYTENKKEKFSEIFEINNENKKEKILYMVENSKLMKLMINKIKQIKSISVKSYKKVSSILDSGLLINEVVNVGSDVEISIIDLAHLIKETLNSKSKISFLPPLKDGDMTRRKPDITKMKSSYKKEIISLKEGIKTVAIENKNDR